MEDSYAKYEAWKDDTAFIQYVRTWICQECWKCFLIFYTVLFVSVIRTRTAKSTIINNNYIINNKNNDNNKINSSNDKGNENEYT